MFIACSDDEGKRDVDGKGDMGADRDMMVGPGRCFDLDDDGALAGPDCAQATDCNDTDPSVKPGAEEVCGDRKDNNCDGKVDEGCPCLAGSLRLCSSYGDPGALQGAEVYCKPGVQRCFDGEWSAVCEGEVGPLAEELCNLIDDDCDGQIDEEVREPISGQCFSDLPPDWMPPAENCGPTGEGNGLDDNGDGQVDETCMCGLPAGSPSSAQPRKDQPCYSGPPATLGVGQCKGGKRDCSAAGTWETCREEVLPQAETCGDGEDNDCDGIVDDGCPICVTGGDEICDGIDNNCDGIIDEGVRNACGGCGAVGPSEICGDGFDNNCNGAADEGCPCTASTQECYIGPQEAAGVGICVKGTQACSGEAFGVCEGSVQPGVEICGNGLDDDCDGETDEGCGCPEGATRPCGSATGVCERGAQTCAGGQWGACEGGVGPSEPGDETSCDGQDNDCDGLTDERLVNACGKCGEPCYLQPANPTQVGMVDGGAQIIPANDPDNPTGRPGVTLSKESTFLPYLWVVNNAQNTLSKFNTLTGLEEARYWAGLEVSRTALDLQGNAYVVGRNDGRVTKIIARESDCTDRNMNGVIDTSRRDAGGNVALVNSAANPLLDECVAMSAVINPTYPSGRGVATDSSGTVWIGYSANNGAIQSLDPFTLTPGQTYPTANIPVYTPDASGQLQPTGANATFANAFGQIYGLVADSRGYVYTSTRVYNGIARFNTMTRQWDMLISGFNCAMYGITVDEADRIWAGCGFTAGVANTGLVMYDPNLNKVFRIGVSGEQALAHKSTAPAVVQELRAGLADECPGCMANIEVSAVSTEPATGHIWAAFHNRTRLGRLRVNAANLAASTWEFIVVPGVSGSTRGIGFDPSGFAWHLDPGTVPIVKVDPNTSDVLGSYPVGDGGHYGYSDFSGSLLFSFTAPRGSWTYRFDTQFEGAQVTSLEWEAYEPAGTSLGARVRAVNPQTGAPLSEWRPAPGAGNQPSYFDYPAGQARDVVNLLAQGGPLVGASFEVEILMTTNDKNVRPILHDIRLGWSRP